MTITLPTMSSKRRMSMSRCSSSPIATGVTMTMTIGSIWAKILECPATTKTLQQMRTMSYRLKKSPNRKTACLIRCRKGWGQSSRKARNWSPRIGQRTSWSAPSPKSRNRMMESHSRNRSNRLRRTKHHYYRSRFEAIKATGRRAIGTRPTILKRASSF